MKKSTLVYLAERMEFTGCKIPAKI